MFREGGILLVSPETHLNPILYPLSPTSKPPLTPPETTPNPKPTTPLPLPQARFGLAKSGDRMADLPLGGWKPAARLVVRSERSERPHWAVPLVPLALDHEWLIQIAILRNWFDFKAFPSCHRLKKRHPKVLGTVCVRGTPHNWGRSSWVHGKSKKQHVFAILFPYQTPGQDEQTFPRLVAPPANIFLLRPAVCMATWMALGHVRSFREPRHFPRCQSSRRTSTG